MTLSATANFTVADGTLYTASATVSVLGAATHMAGQLTHPQLGAYAYANTPDQVEGMDSNGVIVRPLWVHSQTLGGGVDAVWPGNLRDSVVVERWQQGDVGCKLAQYYALVNFFKTLPTDPVTQFVVWAPNYITSAQYNVILTAVRCGGGDVVDLRLKGYKHTNYAATGGIGFAPGPVELEMRVVSAL